MWFVGEPALGTFASLHLVCSVARLPGEAGRASSADAAAWLNTGRAGPVGTGAGVGAGAGADTGAGAGAGTGTGAGPGACAGVAPAPGALRNAMWTAKG